MNIVQVQIVNVIKLIENTSQLNPNYHQCRVLFYSIVVEIPSCSRLQCRLHFLKDGLVLLLDCSVGFTFLGTGTGFSIRLQCRVLFHSIVIETFSCTRLQCRLHFLKDRFVFLLDCSVDFTFLKTETRSSARLQCRFHFHSIVVETLSFTGLVWTSLSLNCSVGFSFAGVQLRLFFHSAVVWISFHSIVGDFSSS